MENEFYGEERCLELFTDDPTFGWLGYVTHNTAEMFEEFADFCASTGRDNSLEESAQKFVEYLQDLHDKALQDPQMP